MNHSLILAIALMLVLCWVALQRRTPEPMRYLISVQPATGQGGGWLLLLLSVGLAAVAVVGWR